MQQSLCSFEFLLSFLTLVIPNACGFRAFMSKPSAPCLCDKCESDVMWFDFNTTVKNRCHLSRTGWGWWCMAHTGTKFCACSKRKYTFRYRGYWIPCGQGSGHLLNTMAIASNHSNGSLAVIVRKAQEFVNLYKQEQDVANEIKDPSHYAALKELQPLIEILDRRDVSDIIESLTEERGEILRRAFARLIEERRIKEEVKSVLDNELREMVWTDHSPHHVERREFAEAMHVCRYDVNRYYGRAAGVAKYQPRDFIDTGDPCASYGGGRYKKVLDNASASASLIKLMEVCKQRDIAVAELSYILQKYFEQTAGQSKFSEALVEHAIEARRLARMGNRRGSRFQEMVHIEMKEAARRSFFPHTSNRVLGLCGAFVRSASDLAD